MTVALVWLCNGDRPLGFPLMRVCMPLRQIEEKSMVTIASNAAYETLFVGHDAIYDR